MTNFFASGAALFPFIGDLAIWKPLVLIIVLKFVGANAMRFWVNKMDKKEEAYTYGSKDREEGKYY